MMRKCILLLCLLVLCSLSLLIGTGCDKLTTEVNNNTFFDSTLGEDCLRCHSDDDNAIAQPKGQWATSRHASSDLIEAHVTLNGRNFESNSCGPQCHTSEGFIRYTRDATTAAQPMPSVINCFTCHMPHTGSYGSWDVDTLRGLVAPVLLNGNIDYNMGKSNMCVHCHQAAKVPTIAAGASAVRLDTLLGPDGPHYSPQAHALVGMGGFRFSTTPVGTSHATVASQGGCLKCHFGTGVGYEYGEHTFRVHNELTGGEYLANCEGSGCHGSSLILNGLFGNAVQDSLRKLSDSIATLLIGEQILTGLDSDSTEYFADSSVTGDQAKILYNYLLYKKDGSQGVHNPDYFVALLTESMQRWDSVPQALFTVDVDSGCAPLVVNVTNQSTGSITGYTWAFTSTDSFFVPNPPAYQFVEPGLYQVSLEVRDAVGSIDRHVIPITVIGIPFIDTVTAEPDTVTLGTPISFAATVTGATLYAWDFGDTLGTAATKDTTYTYTIAGTYMARLTATNDCGAVIDSVQVVVNPPAGTPKRNISRR